MTPKPTYRTANGRFRKETRREHRARFTDGEWAAMKAEWKRRNKIVQHIATFNPWTSLLCA